MTYIITSYKTKSAANKAMQILKATNGKAALIANKDLDEYLFGKQIEDGFKNSKTISVASIKTKLKK